MEKKSTPNPKTFQIYQLSNILNDRTCDVLINHGENKGMGYITDFHGFELENIINRIEDQTQKLTSLPIDNQEPLYLEKIILNNPTYRFDSFFPEYEDYDNEINKGGNRLFTLLFYLTNDCEIIFPKLNLITKHKKGNGLIWNNLMDNKPAEQTPYYNSGNGWIGIKWVRQDKFK